MDYPRIHSHASPQHLMAETLQLNEGKRALTVTKTGDSIDERRSLRQGTSYSRNGLEEAVQRTDIL